MRQALIVENSDIPLRALPMAARKKGRSATDGDLVEIGNRLRWFREALEISTHAKFVKNTDIARTTYLDAENGVARLGLTSMLHLIERYPDLSLDYVYLGRTGALRDMSIRLKIEALMERDQK